MTSEEKNLYTKIDSDKNEEQKYESKNTLGVYELSWNNDDWPVVNFDKNLNDGCAMSHLIWNFIKMQKWIYFEI